MIFEGVSINKLRRSFKVLSVNSRSDNLARFQISSTSLRILEPGQTAVTSSETGPAGDLVLEGVPGLSSQVAVVNRFLRAFGRPFWVPGERESCGFVVHGGHSTGKTFILQRIADTNWGKAFWIKPSDKLSVIRDAFKQAASQQPSMILIDGLERLVSKDRSNHESVIEAIGEELDSLSTSSRSHNALPQVVVMATCLDYLTDVPAELQKPTRFEKNIALPIPRATERLEILKHLEPPLHPEEKEQCLWDTAQKTHAFNGGDLAKLVLNAKGILGNRLDEAGIDPTTPSEQYLSKDDMELARRVTRPTAMHDINLKPPTIHWEDIGGQESLKKVLSRMIKNTKASLDPDALFRSPAN